MIEEKAIKKTIEPTASNRQHCHRKRGSCGGFITPGDGRERRSGGGVGGWVKTWSTVANSWMIETGCHTTRQRLNAGGTEDSCRYTETKVTTSSCPRLPQAPRDDDLHKKDWRQGPSEIG